MNSETPPTGTPVDRLVIRLRAEVDNLKTENVRLRKILAHVPGRVAMKAKEDAGFGTVITLVEMTEESEAVGADTDYGAGAYGDEYGTDETGDFDIDELMKERDELKQLIDRYTAENARLRIKIGPEEMIEGDYVTQCQIKYLMGCCAELLRATHVGDQNFVALLRDEQAEPIRRAVLQIERAMREMDGWPELPKQIIEEIEQTKHLRSLFSPGELVSLDAMAEEIEIRDQEVKRLRKQLRAVLVSKTLDEAKGIARVEIESHADSASA